MLERMVLAATLATSLCLRQEVPVASMLPDKQQAEVVAVSPHLQQTSIADAISNGLEPYAQKRWDYWVEGLCVGGDATLTYNKDRKEIIARAEILIAGHPIKPLSYRLWLNEQGQTVLYKQESPERKDLLRTTPHPQYLFEFLLAANECQKNQRQIPWQTYGSDLVVEPKGYAYLSSATKQPLIKDTLCEIVDIYSEHNGIGFANLKKVTLFMAEGKILAFEVDISLWGLPYHIKGCMKDVTKAPK